MTEARTYSAGADHAFHAALVVDDLSVTMGAHALLAHVHFALFRQEILGVIGPPGAGKSTLLKTICGLYDPQHVQGRLVWHHQTLNLSDQTQRMVWRQRIGMAFQNSALFDAMNVFDNVAFPLRQRRVSEVIIADKVRACLEAVQLAGADHKMPRELSGGMQKRVGIARAAAGDPALGLFDDPTAGLDPQTARSILALITMLTRQYGMATMIVSNDLATLLPICDRIIMLHQGMLVYDGSVEGLNDIDDPLVRQFVHGLHDGPL